MVERDLAKVEVAGSKPVSRSTLQPSFGYLGLGTEAIPIQVFVAFPVHSDVPNVGRGTEMSDNYKVYAQKMSARRAFRDRGRLRDQLVELLRVVERCEAMWALEDRIERSR